MTIDHAAATQAANRVLAVPEGEHLLARAYLDLSAQLAAYRGALERIRDHKPMLHFSDLKLTAIARAALQPPATAAAERPRIVCLCGSTKFRADFERAGAQETLAGNIVLSVGMFGHEIGLEMSGPTKKMLDRLHFRKIEMADEVLIVHPDYIGLSTCDEYHYALALGKPVRMQEAERPRERGEVGFSWNAAIRELSGTGDEPGGEG
jgi:hypothetical protein